MRKLTNNLRTASKSVGECHSQSPIFALNAEGASQREGGKIGSFVTSNDSSLNTGSKKKPITPSYLLSVESHTTRSHSIILSLLLILHTTILRKRIHCRKNRTITSASTQIPIHIRHNLLTFHTLRIRSQQRIKCHHKARCTKSTNNCEWNQFKTILFFLPLRSMSKCKPLLNLMKTNTHTSKSFHGCNSHVIHLRKINNNEKKNNNLFVFYRSKQV